jgi:hypothetical protein
MLMDLLISEIFSIFVNLLVARLLTAFIEESLKITLYFVSLHDKHFRLFRTSMYTPKSYNLIPNVKQKML